MVEGCAPFSPYYHLLDIRAGCLDQGPLLSARPFQNEAAPLPCPQRGEHNPGGNGKDPVGGRPGQGVVAQGDESRDIEQGI